MPKTVRTRARSKLQRRQTHSSGGDDARLVPGEVTSPIGPASDGPEESEDVQPVGTLVCALTGETRVETAQEQTLQSFIEQFHHEYGVAMEDMERDVRLPCVTADPRTSRERTRQRTISLAVFEPGTTHDASNIVRVAVVVPPSTKPGEQAVGLLDEVLSNLSSERDQVFGVWTNGSEVAFRMREYDRRTGLPRCVHLTDIPAPDETLDDLEEADRRPLRVAAGDSLLRTFKRCHDYLYGNQAMRGDKAFWQLLYLIFGKIHDERSGGRQFFVGATEANTEKGRRAIASRIQGLFKEVKSVTYKDVFDGTEKIELNDHALAYVAGELSRYSLLSTDTDAKGLAYEAITSTTLKRERGQFFTPRNVIRMMVEMVDPQPGKRVLDPACGSGGFLVMALAHQRRRLLKERGIPPDHPVPSELRKIDRPLQTYARESLFGIDVDSDLRKAARMNMVMNNDGHGNIFAFNSLDYGIAEQRVAEMALFEAAGGKHGAFDYVFTNPPFGSKIPVTNPTVLAAFDLGHTWTRSAGTWQQGSVQGRVPPEILFIEACCKFLVPGTGVMAIVMPNGILGNPGEQMEGVRWWMLRHMELLASIDLPAETFLPQVSVQASCVFLRRRHPSELRLTGPEGPTQGPVFMAIADQVGHGRRGEAKYLRKPDGSEDLQTQRVMERRETRSGRVVEVDRLKHVKVLADDLPWVARQYRRFVAGDSIEES